jgi:hypothetical protein
MATADDYNRLIGDHDNPLVKEVDQAVEAANNAFLARMADPEFAAAELASADRWAAIAQAEALVGVHGVVMPIAVAKKMLTALRGDDSAPLTPEMLASMLAGYIARQEG